MKILITFLMIFILLTGCSSVGTPGSTSKKKIIQVKNNTDSVNKNEYTKTSDKKNIKSKNDHKNNESKVSSEKSNNSEQTKNENLESKNPSLRFSDTTEINLQPIVAQAIKEEKTKSSNKYYDISPLFNQAIDEFDKGKFDVCCPKFQSISETFLPGDSIYYDSKFYVAECDISRNQVQEAKQTLQILYSDERTPDGILEKVIVRLGQIECILNKPNEAEKFFEELKEKFPESIYLKVANCDVIKKK